MVLWVCSFTAPNYDSNIVVTDSLWLFQTLVVTVTVSLEVYLVGTIDDVRLFTHSQLPRGTIRRKQNVGEMDQDIFPIKVLVNQDVVSHTFWVREGKSGSIEVETVLICCRGEGLRTLS